MADNQKDKLPDFAQIRAEIKQLNDEHKKQNIDELAKSPNKADRELAKAWKE
jgi:hypothetical protein